MDRALTRRKSAQVGLGSYPASPSRELVSKAIDAHRAVVEGKDPGVRAKRRRRAAADARSSRSVKAIDDWLAKAAPSYKNSKSDRILDRALRVHFAPLHARDVTSITTADVAGVLRSLADQTAIKAHTAIRESSTTLKPTLEPHGVPIHQSS